MNCTNHQAKVAWEWAVIIFLVAAGIWLFMPAIDKMQDHAALAEMKQAALYMGRTVNSHWAEQGSNERLPLTLENSLARLTEIGFTISENVTIGQDALLPDGELILHHTRFEKKPFRFSYEGERIP